jgi:hypothetical protein
MKPKILKFLYDRTIIVNNFRFSRMSWHSYFPYCWELNRTRVEIKTKYKYMIMTFRGTGRKF